MLRSVLVALSCLLAATGGASSAEIERSVEYFAVGGTSLAEIHAELARHGPQIGGRGPRHPAAARMEFSTRLAYRQAGGGCAIATAGVTLKAHVILPRLRRSSGLDVHVVRVWDALLSDMKRHEEQHIRIAHTHATRMEDALRRLGRFRDCAQAEAAARRSTDRILAAHDKAQARFDRAEAKGFARRIGRLIEARQEQKR